MTQQQPRQVKIENLSSGTWFLNVKEVPPNFCRVLCCDQNGSMWFDTYQSHGWSSPIAPSVFAWQLPSKPIDIFFEI